MRRSAGVVAYWRENDGGLVQYRRRFLTVWTPALDARDNHRMMPPRPPLTVVRLSDHFGQYVLMLECECGHTRTAQPQTLAALAGWDALLADVVKRLRCSLRQAAVQRHHST